MRWCWRGHEVKIVEGTTVSMPDTPENQKAYPQSAAQKPGLGFPTLRLVALFSLSVGSVLDIAMGPRKGKQTGETALFRSLPHHLNDGDVLLADRYFCSYFEIALVLVRKEIWVHVLAYNLIRKVMAQAAQEHDLTPRQISFKGALQTLNAFSECLRTCAPSALADACRRLLTAVAQHRVGARPNRVEPRAKKRRAKPYPLLNKPREKARKAELTGS